MFKDVDFITFNENYLLFMQMLEDAGVKVPKYLMDMHGGLSAVTQIVDYMYNNKKEDGDFIKEYFTWTYDIIMMKYKSKLENSPKKDKIKPELINTPKKNFQKDMEK